jgi:hypothetical protein
VLTQNRIRVGVSRTEEHICNSNPSPLQFFHRNIFVMDTTLDCRAIKKGSVAARRGRVHGRNQICGHNAEGEDRRGRKHAKEAPPYGKAATPLPSVGRLVMGIQHAQDGFVIRQPL